MMGIRLRPRLQQGTTRWGRRGVCAGLLLILLAACSQAAPPPTREPAVTGTADSVPQAAQTKAAEQTSAPAAPHEAPLATTSTEALPADSLSLLPPLPTALQTAPVPQATSVWRATTPSQTPVGSLPGSALGSAGQSLTPRTVETATAPATTAPATTVTPAPALLPTNTPHLRPMARVVTPINVRTGPGTAYPVLTTLGADSRVEIVGRSPASDWWQVVYATSGTGWLYAPLVEVEGSTAAVAVVVNIPAPPPTATPSPVAPVAVAPTAALAAQPADPAPMPAVPAIAEPTPTVPTAPAVPAAAGPDFRVVGKRLWDVYENGGSLFGDSVTCGEKRQLVVVVVDAQGNRLNGVAVQAEYGAREIFVTGSQGKGDGTVEFVLGGGQDVKVIRDSDGRAVTSEMATGLSTDPAAIPYDYLIAGQFCTDDESCRRFVAAPGCWGHYSWTVTFQRND